MAAARPAWEQALVTNQGVPRYQHWGFDDVIDPRATMRGVAGMTRFMAFFRDHASVDRAVIAWANYARAIDAEFSLVIAQVAANTTTEDAGLRTFLLNLFEHLRNACVLDPALVDKSNNHADAATNVFNLGKPLQDNVSRQISVWIDHPDRGYARVIPPVF